MSVKRNSRKCSTGCAVVGCSNSQYQLENRREEYCQEHVNLQLNMSTQVMFNILKVRNSMYPNMITLVSSI